MKSHRLTFLPFAATAALAFVLSPLHADPVAGAAGEMRTGGGHAATGGSGVHLGAPPVVGHHGGNSGGGHSSGGAASASHISSHIAGSILPPFRRGPWIRVRYGFIYPSGNVPIGGSAGGSSGSPYADDNGDPSGAGNISAFDAATVDPYAVDPSTGYPTAPGTVPNMSSSIQMALANAGYYHGTINGWIGPAAHGAISSFQRAHGLPVTGLVDVYLLHALGLYQ